MRWHCEANIRFIRSEVPISTGDISVEKSTSCLISAQIIIRLIEVDVIGFLIFKVRRVPLDCFDTKS